MGEHEVSQRAVFLDRDGVLNRPAVRDGLPFPPANLAEFQLYPGVAEGCQQLKNAGFLLIVVTNQPDVGRGTQSRESVEAMHAKLRSYLPVLDGIEVCFHAGNTHGEPCGCRKPKPGMLLRAAATHDIDLKRSFLVAIAGATSIARTPPVAARFSSITVIARRCAKSRSSLSLVFAKP